MAMIEIKNISKWYGSFQVLKDCSVNVEKGEVVVVCGPSGSGKSTLIKTVNALEPFQKGEIIVDGISVGDPKTAASRRDIPITSALMSMLAPAGELVAADSYLLTGTPHPLEPRLLRRHYVLLMRRLGLPELKFHALRHTFATRCIESDCDFKTVSVLLGHSSVGTTLNLNVHPGLGQKQRCIDRMMQSVMDRLT